MPKNNDNPGTSDRGQLTASRSPYLPNTRQVEEPYRPPPAPGPGETGPAIAASPARIGQKLAYRALAMDIMHRDAEASAAAASFAAAEKGRRG